MTQRQRVLALLVLNDEDGVTTGEFLSHFLPSFPKRIWELRGEGYEISSERLREGSWRYVLLARPDVERRGGGLIGLPSGGRLPASSPSLSVEEEEGRHKGFWVCCKCGKLREHLGNGYADADEPCPGTGLSVEEEAFFDRTIPEIAET